MPKPHEPHPPPEIGPAEGRRIVDRYTDAETGLLVIEQVAIDTRKEPRVFYTVLDPHTGLPITPQTRMHQLGDAEQINLDHEHQLQLMTRRVVNEHTGAEFYHETVTDLRSGEQVSSSRSVAFSAQPRRTALERYLERLDERRAAQQFWASEYPQRSFEDQCGYWLGYFYRAMRTMGEMGQPEYMLFTPANYREWKTLDPQFDRILVYLLRELPRLFGGDDELPRRMRALLKADGG